MDRTRCYNMDCMEGMKEFPDKWFDLALIDAPYGIFDKIGPGTYTRSNSRFHQMYTENGKTWDVRPSAEYWELLFAKTKNQIIFGANYFVESLPVSKGWVFWNKQGNGMLSVNDELIFTSFNCQIKTFSRCHGLDKGFLADHVVFHPTTKPVALYKWLLKNYAEQGQKILDPFLGSGSSRIAAFDGGFDFTGYELDKDYFEAQELRFKRHKSQLKLFEV